MTNDLSVKEVQHAISDIGARVVDEVAIPPRDERLAQVPQEILDGPASLIISSTRHDGQLWTHQAEALEQLLAGKNVVVSTSTASGKSLIFQTYAFHRVLTDPEAKVAVFYPTRALAADQFGRWKSLASALGLPSSVIGRIDGSVETSERYEIIQQARVLLITPDVCQAWLMRNVGREEIRRFVGGLRLIVIDEAHIYESVFGSNSAFLFRRLQVAKRRIATQNEISNAVQFVATTATIQNASAHLAALTGATFDEITQEDDGSPQHPIALLHVESPAGHAGAEPVLTTLLISLGEVPNPPTFIAFLDSRMGVERVPKDLPDDVLPYRAGYSPAERKDIEQKLRLGTVRGVVSTSALELGIDIAGLRAGMTVGVPYSRKSLLQRIGRVGRAAPGVFLLIAPHDALTQYGQTLGEYFAGAIEPSYLYLGNRFIQFAHARCLFDELEALGIETSRLPGGVDWPEGFESVYRQSRDGYPEEFVSIAQLGGDAPHFNYSLRQIGESKATISTGPRDLALTVEETTLSQAIREAYPGATHYHNGRTYRILRWDKGFDGLIIRAQSREGLAATTPITRKVVTVDISASGVLEGRLRQKDNGFVAEAAVQVFESVEGFERQGSRFSYGDLQANDPRMRRQFRQFSTTGVVIHIDEPWFHDSTTKTLFASALTNAFTHNHSIASQDIDSVGTRIRIKRPSGPQPAKNMIVVYDTAHGGIRLTDALYDNLMELVEKLRRGATNDPGPGQLGTGLAKAVEEWAKGLPMNATGGGVSTKPDIEVPDGWHLVFKPGSVVSVPLGGAFSERKLIRPRLIEMDPEDFELFYEFEHPNPEVKGRIPARSIEALGDEFEYALWKPETGEFQEIEV